MAKRIAVIDREACKPEIADYLCRKVCPVNRSEEECITVSGLDNKPLIDESLCIGCGICSHKCPTKAINIVNLPSELNESPLHRYGKNQFALFRLPVPRHKMVVGLIGQNGIGKSTTVKILSGKLKPNTGIFDRDVGWEEIIEKFKGTELQDYLLKMKGKGISVSYKPQKIDEIPKVYSGNVSSLLEKSGEPKRIGELEKSLGIGEMLSKDVKNLSGGELQMLAVSATLLKDSDLYFFDEPSSYLDVEQRMLVAREIRELAKESMVMVVEHDLAVSDYLADHVHILFGKPACFGIISKPYGVRAGINTYLEGFIKEENVRFREEGITFGKRASSSGKTKPFLSFPSFEKKFKNFSLSTEGGTLYKGEIVGILGPNATGKTTFIRLLTGLVKPDKGEKLKDLRLVYKPQRIEAEEGDGDMTVRDFLKRETESQERGKRVLHVLELEHLMEREVKTLSGGELQTVMIASALGKDFDVLLLDEPTAFLDVEQRLRVAKLLKEVVEGMEKAAFVVDHDLQIVDSVSDRLMVFEGERGIKGLGHSPADLRDGMNKFLKKLGITFRRDPQTGRARANKTDSVLDREQKAKGEYYYMG